MPDRAYSGTGPMFDRPLPATMNPKTKLGVGIALLVAGTAVVFGLSVIEGTLLVAAAAVVSVAALTAGTLLTGLTNESV